jgi:hypothetical protein
MKNKIVHIGTIVYWSLAFEPYVYCMYNIYLVMFTDLT